MSGWAGYASRRNSKPGSPFNGPRTSSSWGGGPGGNVRERDRTGGSAGARDRTVTENSRRADHSARRNNDDHRRNVDRSLDVRPNDGRRPVAGLRADEDPLLREDSFRKVDGGYRRADDGPDRLENSSRRVDGRPRQIDNRPRRVEDSPPRIVDSPRRVDNGSRRRMEENQRQVGDGPRRVDVAPRRVEDGPRRVDGPRRIDDAPRRIDGGPPRVDGSLRRVDLVPRLADGISRHADSHRLTIDNSPRTADVLHDRAPYVRADDAYAYREQVSLDSAHAHKGHGHRIGVPEKRMRLDSGNENSKHYPDYGSPLMRRAADDLEREQAVHVHREFIDAPRHQLLDDEQGLYVDRVTVHSAYAVKYDRVRHSDKMEVRVDKFSHDAERSATLATASRRKAQSKETVAVDEHHKSSRSGSSAVAAVPFYHSMPSSEPFPYETYPDGDNLFNFGTDISDRAIEKRSGAGVAVSDRPVAVFERSGQHFDYRADDDVSRHAEQSPGGSTRSGKRHVGLDLREEVLGGRRYRGIQAPVGNVDAVQNKSSDHALQAQGGEGRTREPFRDRRVPSDMPGNATPATFTRGRVKRPRSRSPELHLPHEQFAAMLPRELSRSNSSKVANRRAYVIERLVNEDDRIRAIALDRRPHEYISRQELSRHVQELWLDYCDRELDADASVQKLLFLDYMNVYYDALLSVYPQFSEYYNDCREELALRADEQPAVCSPTSSSRRPVTDVSRPAAVSDVPTGKRIDIDRAAFLHKKAKGQKQVNRNLTVVKIEEVERPVASTVGHVQHMIDGEVELRGSSYATVGRSQQPGKQHSQQSAGTAVSTIPRRQHPSVHHSRDMPAEPSKTERPSSVASVGDVSTLRHTDRSPSELIEGQLDAPPRDSRAAAGAGGTPRHTGGKGARPSAASRSSKTARPPNDEAWKQSSERLQGTSLVAVADAAAATSAKTVFDDPFMKFLHTTLTAMIVIGELQRQQISGRLSANHQKSLADERSKMEARMRTDMGHKLIKLARCIQEGALEAAKKTLEISDQLLRTVANLDPVVIRTIACTPLLR